MEMNEQRLRARLAALDAAVHMVTGGGRNLVNNYQFVTDTAEAFETWLMRPGHGEHSAAERMRGGMCPAIWTIGGITHSCRDFGDHRGRACTCDCGAVIDALAPVDVSKVDDGTTDNVAGCAFQWHTGDEVHMHRCAGEVDHDGLHHCGSCGVVYIERRA